jgi:hypothetical protein
MSQFTDYRGIFSNGPLTRFERNVLEVALHPNGGITATDDALESRSTQLRPTLRKQSFSGGAKANGGMLAQTRPPHGQFRPAVKKRIRDQ